MNPLISPEALYAQLDAPELRIVDVRFNLRDPEAGWRAYLEAHLPGAHYLHLERDLSGPPGRHGGRHPLPEIARLQAALESVGIANSSHVVVYDDAGGMVAGRLWWLLRYAGHDQVQLLDGGLAAWRQAGYPLTAALPEIARGRFIPNPRPEMVVDMRYVRDNLENPEVLLIDARARARYRGEDEPFDPKAGHIPGALSLPYEENLQDGRFKPLEALTAQYQAAREAEEVIVYCGSGVSAAHDILALSLVGIEAKLYAGSWSDWSSYPDNPIATGDEP